MRHACVFAMLLCTVAVLAAMTIAPAGGSDFNLTWHTIDGGGGTSSGGWFEVSGTIGQPDVGTMSGGDYELVGGFWPGAQSQPTGPECPIVGDLNCDGFVDGADLAVLLGAWGACDDCQACVADLDGTCEVDGADLAILLGNWG